MHRPTWTPSNKSILKMTLIRFGLAFLLTTIGMVFWSCDLTQSSKTTQAASFNSLYDSIKTMDSAIIVFKTEDGRLIDTVFNGRIISKAGFQNLVVDGWDGGKAIIYITAYKAGQLAYSVKKNYDGTTNTTEQTFVIITPNASLTASPLVLTIVEGDSQAIPAVTVLPPDLSDKTLEWSIDHADLVSFDATHFRALKSGTAHLTATLKSNPTKTVVFTILITGNANVPESITIAPNPLHLVKAGASQPLTVKATPSIASVAVTWKSEDSKIAFVTADGIVSGLQQGNTKIIASSKEKPSIQDTVLVDVSAPVAVESIHFIADSTSLFIGGATENLAVIVLPSTANQNVVYTLGDTAKVNLVNGAIKGLIEGTTMVVVTSVENPLKADTLKVTVRALQHVTGVIIAPHSLKLFIGGVTGSLSGSVLPATSTQKVQWQSMDTTIAKVDASGKVTAITAGATRIFARSQADSAKKDSVDITVKRDSPQVTVGHDTVVTVGTTLTFTPVVAPQEYGVVTQFKWDLDGNLVWDDSSTIVKSVSYKFDVEKEYVVRFYVRDTEGNETIVSQKVKATKGPTLTFLTPLTTGTYLTRLSTVDITGGSTTPQGPGAIKKVTYMLGTTVGTLSTNLATNGTGTWSIRGIPLVNNATVDIKVIATDSFGISGQSVLSIQMDSTAPSMPILLGTSPTASLPKWTWTSGGGGTGDFRFKLGDANFSGTEPTVKVLEYPLASAITKTLYTLYVEERDVAGNWSLPASLSILYDLSKPTVTITKPQSSGTYLTRLGTVDLAGGTSSPQGAGTIKTLVYTIDGVAGTLATNLLGDGTWSIKGIPLVNNATVAIKVTATDNLGNQGEASLSATMDASAPNAPSIQTTPPVIVNSQNVVSSLLWEWTRTGALTDSFVIRINGAEVARQKGTGYNIYSYADGKYQLDVSEIDLAGNASSPTSSSIVTVDRVAPGLPILNKPKSPNTAVTWTWTRASDSYVTGTPQCQLGTGPVETCPSKNGYPVSIPVNDSTYTLHVRDLDSAGNWSSWVVSEPVTIDLEKPKLTMGNYLTVPSQITNTIETFLVTASDNLQLDSVQFQDGSGAGGFSPAVHTVGENWIFKPTLAAGATKDITVRAKDLAGNQTSLVVQITYQPTVLFVRQKATGKGDGSSWENAFTELGPRLVEGTNYPGKTNIWVSEGTYLPAAGVGFTFKSNTAITGGFADQGGDRTIAGRDLISNVSYLNTHPDGLGGISNNWMTAGNIVHIVDNFELADFTFTGGGYAFATALIDVNGAKKALLKNIKCNNFPYISELIRLYTTSIDIINCEFSGNITGYGALHVMESNVRMLNTKINDNLIIEAPGGGITFGYGSVCVGSGTSISGNIYNPYYTPTKIEVEMGYHSSGQFITREEVGVNIGPGIIDNPGGYGKVLSTSTACPSPF